MAALPLLHSSTVMTEPMATAERIRPASSGIQRRLGRGVLTAAVAAGVPGFPVQKGDKP